jgi:hypothetical protein
MKRDANAAGGDAAAMGSSFNKGLVAPDYAQKMRRPTTIWNSMSGLRPQQAADMRHQESIGTRLTDSQARESSGSDLRWRIEIASGIHQDGRGKDEAKDRRYEERPADEIGQWSLCVEADEIKGNGNESRQRDDPNG